MRKSIFSTLLFRKDKNVSIAIWLKLILLESYLGEQIVEMLSVTSSFKEKTSGSNFGGSSSTGVKEEIEYFIPSTKINQFLKNQIIELIEKKYLQHYEIIREAPKSDSDPTKKYEVNPSNLYMLVELKLAYNTIWVSLNITIDLIVYLMTQDLASTLAAGALIEFIRRFKW